MCEASDVCCLQGIWCVWTHCLVARRCYLCVLWLLWLRVVTWLGMRLWLMASGCVPACRDKSLERSRWGCERPCFNEHVDWLQVSCCTWLLASRCHAFIAGCV